MGLPLFSPSVPPGNGTDDTYHRRDRRHRAGTGAALCCTGGAARTGRGGRAPAELDTNLFTPARYCRADLSQPEQATQTVAAFCHQHALRHIDLLIHNAGIGYYGPLEQQPWPSIEALVAVNLAAPIELTHTLLPYIEQARGRLVFISSVVSVLPAPDYAVYSATKAALDGFARSLRLELRGRVSVQVIHPGATRTAMHAKKWRTP
ncbi:MAG: SDR family NAD(P)-dependent oxidoreductase [Chloroflexaceae bacterium]|nr:SDR family NAD(P)-dependent oxidoreductase [Chloroflexaceae bacterium]